MRRWRRRLGVEDAGVRFGQRRAGRLRVGERVGNFDVFWPLRRQHGWSVKQFARCCEWNPAGEGRFCWGFPGEIAGLKR
jgi:hypothetical protein